MNFKNILFFCFFLYTTPLAFSQNEEPKKEDLSKLSFKQRLVYNIGGGLFFGTITNVNLLPQVGYRITPRLTSGIGGNFMYYRDNRYTGNNEFIVYGGNVFTRYAVSQEFFLQAEDQVLVYNYNSVPGNYGLIGGGYRPGKGVYISAYYLLFYPPDNIYGAPYLIRFGFIF
jgi:hypothetical protein